MKFQIAIVAVIGALFFFPLIGAAQTVTAQANPEQPDCTQQEQQARRQLTSDANNPTVQTALGDALACLQDWEGAITAYRAAIEQYQTSTDATADPETTPLSSSEILYPYFKLARVLVKADQLNQALTTYRQAIALDPMYGYLIGLFDDRQYSPLGEPITDASVRGEGASAPATADSSVDASAYFELGKALDEANRWIEAIDAYEQAIKLSPSFAHAYNALGQALFRMGRHEEAKAAYERAIQLNPELVWAYYNLGYLLTWQAEPEQGFGYFRQVVGFHTGLDTLGEEVKDAIAYTMVGDVYMKQGNSSPAIDAYQRAIALSPQDSSVYLQLGNAFLARGDAAPAITAFRQALEQLPEDAAKQQTEAYLGIGQALIQIEDWQQAKENIEKALSLSPDSVAGQELLNYVNTR